ncbi:MAG TPA: hypothetical protein VH481_11185 [Nitrososphaeraceae archaeon]
MNTRVINYFSILGLSSLANLIFMPIDMGNLSLMLGRGARHFTATRVLMVVNYPLIYKENVARGNAEQIRHMRWVLSH